MKHMLHTVAAMGETGTRTIDRALSLLTLVCDQESISLADAARGTKLSASTALRLLRTLEAREFVRRDSEGLFSPGPRLVQLGASALSNDSLIAAARPAMRRVAAATTESCYLSVFGAGDTALHVAIAEGTQSIRHASWVGRTIPLAGTAVGRVLVGEKSPEGYIVVSEGVEKNVTSISTPINVGKRVVAALSCLVPSFRVDDETKIAKIGVLLREEAAGILSVRDENPVYGGADKS